MTYTPYTAPRRSHEGTGLLAIAGHDLAIETTLAEMSRLETREAELLDEGATEANPAGELALVRMRLRSLPRDLSWHLAQTRKLRRGLGMAPHALDQVPQLMAAE